jgi:hypothetical protein
MKFFYKNVKESSRIHKLKKYENLCVFIDLL